MSNVLVVAAHPDDESIGMAGTILRHVEQGDRVCVVTAGVGVGDGTLLPKFSAVMKFLGVHEYVNGRFSPDQELDIFPLRRIAGFLEDVQHRFRPSTVYTHCSVDLNRDHRIIHEASLVAFRPKCGVQELLAYEVLTTTEIGMGGFWPDMFCDVTKYVARKLEAIGLYGDCEKYVRVRELALYRGFQGFQSNEISAEAFETIRRTQ